MAPQPHIIRLREPWTRGVLPGSDSTRIRLKRLFRCPTGLDPTSRVLLSIGPLGQAGHATINGQRLTPPLRGDARSQFDVSDQLSDRNHLAIELDGPFENAEVNTVQLEIHELG